MRNLDKHVLCLLGPPRHLISTYKTERQKTNCEKNIFPFVQLFTFKKKTRSSQQHPLEVKASAVSPVFANTLFRLLFRITNRPKVYTMKQKFQQFNLIETEVLTINQINKNNKSRKPQLISNFTCICTISLQL